MFTVQALGLGVGVDGFRGSRGESTKSPRQLPHCQGIIQEFERTMSNRTVDGQNLALPIIRNIP